MTSKWETVRLGDILERSIERLGLHAEPTILTCTENDGLVDQMLHMGRRVATEDVSKYKTVKPMDIVYNVYLLWVGSIGQNLTGKLGITSPVYEVFHPKSGVYSRYLGLILRSPAMVQRYKAISIGTVPRRRRTPWESFLSLEIALPPFSEQRRIVDLIGELDGAIEAAESASDFLDATHAQVLLSEIESIDGPEHPLISVFEYMIGGAWGSPSGEDDTATLALGPSAFASGRTEVDDQLGTLRSLNEKRAYARFLHEGDIILERSGGSPAQPVGRVLRMGSGPDNIVPSDFMRLLRVDKIVADPAYVFWVLWSKYKSGESLQFQKFTTGIRNLNITDYLNGTSIKLPSIGRQREIAGIAELLLQTGSEATNHLANLRALRSELLTALLSGAHEIPESYDEVINAT